MSFFLLEVTKFALAGFDHTELADELKESTHQTNFQMLSVFYLYGKFPIITSEANLAQGK